MDKGLGERIEWLRNAAGLSARELDALAGLRAGHTRSLETGVISNVGVHTLKKIAAVFGPRLDWRWLVTGQGARRAKKLIAAAVARTHDRAVDNRGATD